MPVQTKNDIVFLTPPPVGITEHIATANFHKLDLGFDTSKATFDRVDSSMSISVDNAGTVVLDNIFNSEHLAKIDLVLQDGSQVRFTDLASALGNTDMIVCSGPGGLCSGATPSSSGMTEYYDNAGNLLDGVHALTKAALVIAGGESIFSATSEQFSSANNSSTHAEHAQPQVLPHAPSHNIETYEESLHMIIQQNLLTSS